MRKTWVFGVIVGLIVVVAIIYFFMPRSEIVTQNQDVQAFNIKLENAYNQVTEYSTHVIARGMDGKISKEFDYYFKKPSMAKLVWSIPDNKIELTVGTSRQVYIREVNTIYNSNIPVEDQSILDFVDVLRNYLKTNKADVENIIYNTKDAYKLTVVEDDGYKTIYFIDKETMWPVKIEYYMSKKKCDNLMAFYNTYNDNKLESCMTSEELNNITLNPELNDDFFNLKNDVPADVKSRSGFGGECNPVFETAKPLKDASFQVYVPGWIPERSVVNFAPVVIPKIESQSPGGCEISEYSRYANVHTERIYGDPWDKEELEVAETHILINSSVEQNGTTYVFSGDATLKESPSVIIWRNLAFDKPNESRQVDLGKTKGTLNVYNSKTYDAIVIYWKQNGIYYWLETPTMELYKLRNSAKLLKPGAGDEISNWPDAPSEIVFNEGELIKIASGLIPLDELNVSA